MIAGNEAVVETDIPARLDALPWGRFHTLVVAALGITWILDGLEVTLTGALGGVLKETSTLGLRIYSAERRVQSRSWADVETPYGRVRVKVSGEGGYAPEYEDCRKLAGESGVALKTIIAEANYAYLNQTR